LIEGRIFGLDTQMLISIGTQLLNACILAAVLTFILYKPVRKFLQNRTEKIKEQFSSAAESKERADALRSEYEKKLAALEIERIEILESAHKQAAEKNRLRLLDAEKEAAYAKEQAASEIHERRERAGEELRTYIIETATALAGKFISHAIDDDTKNRLFDETIASLEDSAWKN